MATSRFLDARRARGETSAAFVSGFRPGRRQTAVPTSSFNRRVADGHPGGEFGLRAQRRWPCFGWAPLSAPPACRKRPDSSRAASQRPKGKQRLPIGFFGQSPNRCATAVCQLRPAITARHRVAQNGVTCRFPRPRVLMKASPPNVSEVARVQLPPILLPSLPRLCPKRHALLRTPVGPPVLCRMRVSTH